VPFASEKQRKYLHANEPEVAQKWEKEYPKRGSRAQMNKQKRQAKTIRSASNQGGASIGGGSA
jgi:hypothetical protein